MTFTDKEFCRISIASWPIAALILFFSACSHSSKLCDSGTDANITNLQALSLLIRGATGESDSTPKSLLAIAESKLSPPGSTKLQFFVCPATGHHPGPIGRVAEWSDYIYVGNMPEGVVGAPLVIDPPENHNAKFGYVLWSEFYVSRLPPEQIHRLIADPLCMDTKNSSDVLDDAEKRIVIQIPERLKRYYSSK